MTREEEEREIIEAAERARVEQHYVFFENRLADALMWAAVTYPIWGWF